MDPDLNPYAPPSTHLQPPPATAGRSPGRVRFWLAITIAIVIVAGSVPSSALAMRDIETIIFSGMLYFPLAIVLFFLSLPPRLRPLWGIAIPMILIPMGIFGTIFVNRWNPSDAQQPIGYATIVCAAVMQLGWIAVAFVSLRKRPVEG